MTLGLLFFPPVDFKDFRHRKSRERKRGEREIEQVKAKVLEV